MQFLADESCDFAVVRALRDAGHDVVAVAEVFPRAEDRNVLARALDEGRILVVFFRFPARARRGLAKAAGDLVRQKGTQLSGRFVVVQPGRIRVGPSPEG